MFKSFAVAALASYANGEQIEQVHTIGEPHV